MPRRTMPPRRPFAVFKTGSGPLYEQPLAGPELSESNDFPVDRYLSPRSEVDPSRAEEALRQALTASSKIEMQASRKD